jgi:tRNA threonylcarbamoyl adenosine modification protein YjeE
MTQNSAKFHLAHLESTQKFGQYLGQMIEANTLLALAGEIGSGKTTLVKSIAKALGILETVTSPTFVMLNEYRTGRLPLYHLDLYRLSDENSENISFDLITGLLDEILNTKSIIIIEWANIFLKQYEQDLSKVIENGYLSLLLEPDKKDDHARLLTVDHIGVKNKTSFFLFEKLCKLPKNTLA